MDNNGNGAQSNRQACAACKHQRKKCSQQCILSPFFPAEKNQQFQAVHKLFGVSNVTKLLRGVHVEDRKQAIDSLIWEAQCREADPVLGCYGQYSKIVNELQFLKNQHQQQQQEVMVAGAVTRTNHAENMMNNKQFGPGLIDYPYDNGINGGAGPETTVLNYNNMGNNNGYLQRNAAGFYMEPMNGYVQAGKIHDFVPAGQEKRFQRRDGNNLVGLPNSFNQGQQYHYDNVKL